MSYQSIWLLLSHVFLAQFRFKVLKTILVLLLIYEFNIYLQILFLFEYDDDDDGYDYDCYWHFI